MPSSSYGELNQNNGVLTPDYQIRATICCNQLLEEAVFFSWQVRCYPTPWLQVVRGKGVKRSEDVASHCISFLKGSAAMVENVVEDLPL